MKLEWRALPLHRLRSSLALLFAITFLAAGAMSLGAGMLADAQLDLGKIPAGAEYYVVARAVDGDAVGQAIAVVAGAEVRAQLRAGEILARAGTRDVGPDHLVVLEVHVSDRGDVSPNLRALDGVVDVIDLNASARAEFTRSRVVRGAVAGAGLLLLGCVVFVWAVVACAHAAGRECQDTIGVRVLLGVEAEGLWGPLGLAVGGVALAGGLASFAVTAFVVRAGIRAATLPVWWELAGLSALFLGTLGLAFGSARRAVARAARATVLAGLVVALVGVPVGHATGAPPPRGPQHGPVRDADILRALSRDLAVCRRAVHVARKGIAATELHGVVAAANADEALLRLAAAKRAQDVAALGEGEERCSALVAERQRLRGVLRSTRLLGPPIKPRQSPVQGDVAVRYGQAGRQPGTAGYRNGIALRTRGGESVRATAPGRVAYSGELPGSGSVVVIDHGRRTYSVYAKIGSSIVEVGEKVGAGQTVARARPGLLYFSVRHRGHAVDPLGWVANAPKG